jgi:hypothetical protein
VAIVKSIKYRDRGLNQILKQLNASGTLGGRVGVLEPQAGGAHPLRGNITVGEVAIINEFGSRRARVPRRSYLRSTFKNSRDTFKHLLTTALKQVATQQLGPRAALQIVGAEMVKEVKRTIEGTSVPPPNHPVTIKNKGHDHTLMHTETLLHSISHDVIAKSGNKYRDESYLDQDAVGADEGGE